MATLLSSPPPHLASTCGRQLVLMRTELLLIRCDLNTSSIKLATQTLLWRLPQLDLELQECRWSRHSMLLWLWWWYNICCFLGYLSQVCWQGFSIMISKLCVFLRVMDPVWGSSFNLVLLDQSNSNISIPNSTTVYSGIERKVRD